MNILMPAGLSLIVDEIPDLESASQVIDTIEKYRRGEFKPVYPRGRDQSINKLGMTDWDYDIVDAERWRIMELAHL